MRLRIPILCLLLSVAVTLPLLAQGQPTARVKGLVTDTAGEHLPGVTVTVASPQIQGSRVMVTDMNGVWNAPPVLPGEFEITFQLEGYQTVTRRVRLNANMNVTVNARLDLSSVAEEIVVTGEAVETISQDSTAAATITKNELDNLPVTRTLNSAIALAPGVSATGPSNALTISGAQSWENLFTLNGVVLNENLRGQAFALFIEDAIQETTTASAGVSAEWGRFAGGVVTAITKSGGNRFEGSYRATWTNDDWNGKNEFTPDDRSDSTNRIDEATLGGRIIKDHLWFFLAGRDFGIDSNGTTSLLNISYPTGREQTRVEAKLTGGSVSHQLQASYIEIDDAQANVAHGGLTGFAVTVDDGSLSDRETPQDLSVISYNGVITPNFFLEAQYGERNFTFEGGGGQDQSIAGGTPNFDLAQNVVHNESLFCDGATIPACTAEVRNNEQARIKGTYFLSTSKGGSHDIAFGWEDFTDIRAADNHQSANDLMVWNFAASTINEGAGTATMNLVPGASFLTHLPILEPGQPSDFQTSSLFVNDRWRLGDKWSFNLGLRYDSNDSVNSQGLKVADDSAWGPRLSANYDLGANGKNVFHASYSVYVGPQNNGIFGSSSAAGTPAVFGYIYLGPGLGPEFGTNDTNEEMMEKGYNWLQGQCPNAIDFDNTFAQGDPFSCDLLAIVEIPGATTVLDPNLGSSTSTEISLGYQHDFGRTGSIRADWVHRDFGDMFTTQRDLVTGVGGEPGAEFDQGVVINEDSILERKYDGLHMAFNFRFMDSKMRVGGNYTLSKTSGNFNGETAGSGAITSDFFEYPEYKEEAWSLPKGNLAIDQRHRLRAWIQYDLINSDKHLLNASWLENLFSGTPYSADVGDIDTVSYVDNPGYITPPTEGVPYFFSRRGAFTTDTVHRSDLALNYTWRFADRWGLFVQPQVRNLFNESATTTVNDTVLTENDSGDLVGFNPFTEMPVEGVNWRKGDQFGQGTEEDDLQLVRTWAITFALRFSP